MEEAEGEKVLQGGEEHVVQLRGENGNVRDVVQLLYLIRAHSHHIHAGHAYLLSRIIIVSALKSINTYVNDDRVYVVWVAPSTPSLRV